MLINLGSFVGTVWIWYLFKYSIF